MTEIEKIQSKILMRMQEVENYFPTMSTSNFGKSAFAKALLVAISLILNRRFVGEIESTVIR